ncbi:uncharacterized protein METZ01_LOCUS516427, partial [marine metagenome]
MHFGTAGLLISRYQPESAAWVVDYLPLAIDDLDIHIGFTGFTCSRVARDRT